MTKLMETIAGDFGQKLTEAKRSDSVTFLTTPDGFLYAILEDLRSVTQKSISDLVSEGLKTYKHLVLLSPVQIPPEFLENIKPKSVTVVQGDKFDNLLKALDLQSVPEVKTADKPERRALPTADRLDHLMKLGEEWTSYGVPALAARFYGEASRLKPEFVPAILGLGESYLNLSLGDLAQASFDKVLELQEDNFAARLGLARSHGIRGRVKKEIENLQVLLRQTSGNITVRAHLLAALIEAKRWDEALEHVEEILKVAPQEGRFHAMKAALLHHTGQVELAKKEERLTLSLGVSASDLARVYSTMYLTVDRTPPPRTKPSPRNPPVARKAGKGKPKKKGSR